MHDLLDALVADGMILPEEAANASRHASLLTADQHALVVLAQRKLRNQPAPNRILDLECLTEWLARRVGLDVRAHRSAAGRTSRASRR